MPATIEDAVYDQLRRDGIRRAAAADGSQVWETRVGPGPLGFALANDEAIAVLELLLAVGDITVGPGMDEFGFATVRLAMARTDDAVEMLRYAKTGRMHTMASILGSTYYLGSTLPVIALAPARDVIEELIERGYLHDTRRANADGTTMMMLTPAGFDALKAWSEQ